MNANDEGGGTADADEGVPERGDLTARGEVSRGRSVPGTANPVRTDVRHVVRERLFTRLDRALAAGSVCLSGGAGTGKSALVASYLDIRALSHRWFRLDAEDADPFHLTGRLERLSAVAERGAFDGEARTRLPLTEAAVPDPFVAGRRAFRRLFAAHEAPCVLVFDDLERLPAGCPGERILADALDALPDGWSMVLAGRGDVPSAFARAQASATLDTIDEGALRLTPEESAAIAVHHAPRVLADEELERIVARADGWAALTVLLANASRAPPPDVRAGDVPDAVFDYFAEEVVTALDGPRRHALESLALPPLVTGTLAARVGAGPDASVAIDELAARHFFVERVERPGGVDGTRAPRYRLHALFRTFLIRRLRRRLGAEALRTEAIETARVLEADGEHESALALLLEHGAFDEAVPRVRRLAPRMIQRQRHVTVLGWMRTLPPARVHACGSLSLWCGVATMIVDPPAAREHLERAWRAFEGTDSPEAVLSCCIAIDTWLVHWDDFHGMDPWLARLRARLAADTLPPDPDLGAHVACAMLNACLFRGDDPRELDDWHEHGLALLDHRIDPTVYMMLAQALVVTPLWTRSLARAELVLERVRATVFADDDVEPLVELWYRTLEAPVRWNQGDRAGAEHACTRGLACARESGAGFSDVLLPYHAGIACLIAGDGDAAAPYAERVAAAVGTRSERLMDVTCHHQLAGMFARHRGRLDLAAEHLERAAERATAAGLGFAAAMQHAGLAHVAAERGDEALARRWLAAARDDVGNLSLSMIDLDLQLCEAWLAHRRDGAALGELRTAFATARRDARVAGCWWSRDMLAALCAAALDADIEPAHVCRIVRTHALVAPPGHRHLAAWPWPVRVHLLGRPRIVVNDEQLAADGARGAKPTVLLHALAALGGSAPAASLADLLWPDAEGDAAMGSFKTTLSRARRQLGVDGALTLVDGRLSFDSARVWCDVVELVRLDRKAVLADDDVVGRHRADEAIIALYRGDFLPGEPSRWATDARRRTRERWLRSLSRRGAALAAAGRHAAAAGLFEAALERAPTVESLYRQGMGAHLRAGTPEAGLLLYHRCRAETGDAPDAATGALRDALRVATGAA